MEDRVLAVPSIITSVSRSFYSAHPLVDVRLRRTIVVHDHLSDRNVGSEKAHPRVRVPPLVDEASHPSGKLGDLS